MDRIFSSMGGLALFTSARFMAAPLMVNKAVVKELRAGAQKVKSEARKKFGEYQPASGPFVGWAALSPKYLKYKLAAGAPSDMPLIGYYFKGQRSAIWPIKLKNSLAITIDDIGLIAYIGTNDPLGEWHEYGLLNRQTVLPPRPFLRPALYENIDQIYAQIGLAVGLGMVGVFK